VLRSTPAALCFLLLLADSATARSRAPLPTEQPERNVLMNLFASDSLDGEMDELVIKSLPLARTVLQTSGSTLHMREATSYRVLLTRGENKEMRLLVALRLSNTSARPWTAHGVTVSTGGEESKGASISKAEPIPPKEMGWLVVEVVVTEARARGPVTLTLRDESGGRALQVENVTFP
jgi:hypothetical protein